MFKSLLNAFLAIMVIVLAVVIQGIFVQFAWNMGFRSLYKQPPKKITLIQAIAVSFGIGLLAAVFKPDCVHIVAKNMPK